MSARPVALLTAVLGVACAAGPVVASGEGYRHRELGYTIASPGPGAGPWRAIRVEGADLAFLGADGVSMSLLSRCKKRSGSPRLEARNLTIGLGERTPLAAGPISLSGAPGWAQSFEVQSDGAAVRVHTVTLLAGGCIFDWILSGRAPAEGGAAEEAWRADLRAFDTWWRSFRFPASGALPAPDGEA